MVSRPRLASWIRFDRSDRAAKRGNLPFSTPPFRCRVDSNAATIPSTSTLLVDNVLVGRCRVARHSVLSSVRFVEISTQCSSHLVDSGWEVCVEHSRPHVIEYSRNPKPFFRLASSAVAASPAHASPPSRTQRDDAAVGCFSDSRLSPSFAFSNG